MIDFIKIEVSNVHLIESIRCNNLLKYKSETQKANYGTGELYFILRYEYQKLSFIIITDSDKKAKKLYISGSFHYYFNDGLHNANDFYLYDFIEVVNELKGKFNIDPDECKLRSLEYGINIIPASCETRLILQNTFYHQRKKFIEPISKPYKQAGIPRQNDFIVKIYDKGFQYPEYTNGELLRFEIKFMRMRELNKINITYLSDLLLKENHFKLREILLQRFSEILFYDFTISSKDLTKTKQKNILNYSNPNYWENILLKIEDKVLSYDNFKYHKNRLTKIISKHSENIQQQLTQIIEEKTSSLLDMGEYGFETYNKVYPIYTTIESENCTPYTHLYIGCEHSTNSTRKSEDSKYQKERKCLVTGVDISMQKDGSFLLSHTGLKYLYQNDRKLFEDVKQRYIYKKYENADFQIQIREIYHGIRDKRRNQKTKQERLHPPGQHELFNINF